jgi:hypothetical protein
LLISLNCLKSWRSFDHMLPKKFQVSMGARSFFLPSSRPKLCVKSWQHWLLLLIPRGLEHFLWNSISGGRVSTLQIPFRLCELCRVFQLWGKSPVFQRAIKVGRLTVLFRDCSMRSKYNLMLRFRGNNGTESFKIVVEDGTALYVGGM